MTSLRFKVATAIAALVALVMAPATAFAAYPPAGPVCGETTTTPGSSVSFTCTGYEPGETISVTMTGEEAATGSLAAIRTAVTSTTITKAADSNGDLNVTATVPTSAVPGNVYEVEGAAESGSATHIINIVAADSGTGAGSGSAALPKTGVFASQGVLIGGIALLLAGVAIVFVARRKTEQN